MPRRHLKGELLGVAEEQVDDEFGNVRKSTGLAVIVSVESEGIVNAVRQ